MHGATSVEERLKDTASRKVGGKVEGCVKSIEDLPNQSEVQ